jgi:hypothetical protein
MKLAELYQEAARVAKLIEGTHLRMAEVVKINGQLTRDICYEIKFNDLSPGMYEFALAILEGRPVFRNDWIYFKGEKYSANDQLFKFEMLSNFSWNPPKPKTVMVELLREDAEEICKFAVSFERQAKACKKALEE